MQKRKSNHNISNSFSVNIYILTIKETLQIDLGKYYEKYIVINEEKCVCACG